MGNYPVGWHTAVAVVPFRAASLVRLVVAAVVVVVAVVPLIPAVDLGVVAAVAAAALELAFRPRSFLVVRFLSLLFAGLVAVVVVVLVVACMRQLSVRPILFVDASSYLIIYWIYRN